MVRRRGVALFGSKTWMTLYLASARIAHRDAHSLPFQWDVTASTQQAGRLFDSKRGQQIHAVTISTTTVVAD